MRLNRPFLKVMIAQVYELQINSNKKILMGKETKYLYFIRLHNILSQFRRFRRFFNSVRQLQICVIPLTLCLPPSKETQINHHVQWVHLRLHLYYAIKTSFQSPSDKRSDIYNIQ